MEKQSPKNRLKMKWSMCQCEVNGLVRPTNGPLRIKETDVMSPDVLRAKLSGPEGGVAAIVKDKNRFYYVSPDKKVREIPADTLTDGLHAAVWIRNEELKAKKKLPHAKRPMPHVPVDKFNKRKKA